MPSRFFAIRTNFAKFKTTMFGGQTSVRFGRSWAMRILRAMLPSHIGMPRAFLPSMAEGAMKHAMAMSPAVITAGIALAFTTNSISAGQGAVYRAVGGRNGVESRFHAHGIEACALALGVQIESKW
jgi:hypothetical protein